MFFFFACLYRLSSRLFSPTNGVLRARSFSVSDAINVFCLPFVGQFIIVLLLSAFHILSTVLFIAVLPLTRSIGPCILHFILYEDYVCRNSIYVHSYGHHCASSILSSVIMFPFIFLHMGIIIVLIVIPSIWVRVTGTDAPAIKRAKSRKETRSKFKEPLPPCVARARGCF